MSIWKGTLSALVLGAIVLLQSCYPKGAEFVDELDLVRTTYDEQYDFGTKTTFLISDQIPKIGTDPIEYVNAATTAKVIAAIVKNMEDQGYTKEVDINADPDIFITMAALEVKTTVVGCGGGWGGYYPPGWGYPGYPGYGGCWYPVGYSYTTGTLLISLWDKDSLPDMENDPTVPEWSAGINGLLQGSQSSIDIRIVNSINQAFRQSPYIFEIN